MPEPYDALAVGAMAAYCGWDPTALVQKMTYLDGAETESIFIPSLYVTGVSSVTVTSGPDTFTLTIANPGESNADVAWGEDGELRLLPQLARPFRLWPAGKANIAVSWSGGYSMVPNDLDAALTSIGKRTAGTMATTAKIGTASISLAQSIAEGGLLNVEQWILDNYRIPRVR